MKALKHDILIVIVAIVLVCSVFVPNAYAQEKQVVKVGFPIQSGISYIDENGNHAGYMVDYLEQLLLYTDWEVEYVEVEGDLNTQLSTLLNMLTRGEIDLMGTMNRSDVLEEMFLYPKDSYGLAHTVLAVKDESGFIRDSYTDWNGIRVASCPSVASRMELLAQYAQVNGFHYEVVEYETYEEMIHAVATGEADAMLQVDISMEDGYRTIGSFAPKPYYFSLAPDREDLLDDLNNALEIVSTSYENLQNELYQRYFMETGFFRVSEAESAYIQSLGTLRVLFFEGNAPYQFIKNGELTGYAVDYFKNFAKEVELDYEAVVVDGLEDAVSLLESGEIDLIACISTNSALSYEPGTRLSLPYVHSYVARTCSINHIHEEDEEIPFRMNTETGLADILDDEEYCAWLDEYSLNYYHRKKVIYDDVVVDWAGKRDSSYAVALTDNLSDSDMMISLLNQYASSQSKQSAQTAISAYLSDHVEYTASEWIRANLYLLITVVLLLFFTGLAFYLYRRRVTYKNLINENKLLHLSIYDDLTGAYNRAYFCKVLEQRIDEGSVSPGAMIALDIRNFKYINDTYGTIRADQILCKFKEILTEDLSENELVCRLSADCFYLCIQESLPEDIYRRLDEIQDRVRDMVEELLDGYQIAVSCGVISSEVAPDLYYSHASLNCLTVALAHAKKAGEAEVCIYDDTLHQEQQLRQYIEANMHRALEEEEFEIYLQPKKNLHTGKIDSAEALVRWNSPERGLLLPNQFIPQFEQNGFCKELDLYMVEKACQTLRSWMDDGLDPITISVNQTRSLFVSDGYVEKLLEITARCRISPQYIILEILEGLAFENTGEFNEAINRLHEAGFRVSMDDFGAGYSSLNTLGKLNIDEIKLDRMFLMDLRTDKRQSQYEIMDLIFAMTDRLHVKTVTEGVESKEDEDLIIAMGCDYGQGYYYSKPIPADLFKKLHLNHN